MSTDESPAGRGAKIRAHEQARERDVRDYFDFAEQIDVIVEKPPEQNGGEEAVATTSRGEARDVKVYITPGQHTLHRGDRVRCRIKHVDYSYLKSLALCRLD